MTTTYSKRIANCLRGGVGTVDATAIGACADAEIARLQEKLLEVAEHRDQIFADNARLQAQVDALAGALACAEAALSDIGDADREPGDDVKWCEQRAAEAIPTVRAALAATGR